MPRTALRPAHFPALQAITQSAPQRQVYLLEPHPGTLCRLLDLYAARGLAVSSLRYEHAAPQTMMLTVIANGEHECLRVLVSKAAAQFGVIEAAMA